MILKEKVYTFNSLRYYGMDFQRSIALNEMICFPVFVLTCGLSVLLGCMSSNVAMYFTDIMKDVLKYIEW